MRRQHWLTVPVAVLMGALVLVAFAASGAGVGGPGLAGGSTGTLANFKVQSGGSYGLEGGSGSVEGLSASGSAAVLRGSTIYLQGTSGSPTFAQLDSTGFTLPPLAGTAGSGTGITANATALVGHYVHKITVARTALTAAATTQDVTIWTVPAKTRVLRVVEDVTAAFDDAAGPISAVVTRCGPAANSAAYLLDGSVFATGTLGDVAAEIGAGLLSATVADIPSFSATTAISCRWTATGANLSTLTTGSSTFYIEAFTYP